MDKNSKELNRIGLKATQQRLRILDLLRKSWQKHLSAEEIYQIMQEENGDASLATIYRALAQFEQAGLIERHQFEQGKSVFEIKENTHHDHFICVNCGHVEEFANEELEKLKKKIAQERGYIIVDHSLNLYIECQCVKENCISE